MALAKNAMDAAHNVEYSSILTTMARNGYEFGIRVSGLEGNQWFTGPAQVVVGPLFAGFKPEDSGLDIGDQRHHRNLWHWRIRYVHSPSHRFPCWWNCK